MNRLKLYVILLFSLCTVSCATVDSEQSKRDPYEKYNRAMFKVNETLDDHILKPVAVGYSEYVPSPMRTAVTNVFNNFRDVVSLGSNILRLDIDKASMDLVRVSFNTTFGLGGMMGLADLVQMPNNKNTLGDTFASWGWKNSHYLVMPILGPSTVRDATGNVITTVYSPESFLLSNHYVYYSTMGLKGIDLRSGFLSFSQSLDHIAIDKYAYIRDIYMGLRNKQTGGTIVQDDTDIDDLVGEDSDPHDTNIDDLVDFQEESTETDIDDLVDGKEATKEVIIHKLVEHEDVTRDADIDDLVDIKEPSSGNNNLVDYQENSYNTDIDDLVDVKNIII